MGAPTKGYRPADYLPFGSRLPIFMNHLEDTVAITAELWVKVDTLEDNGGLLTTTIPDSDWFSQGLNLYLRTEPGRQIALTLNGRYRRAGNMLLGEWCHLAFVLIESSLGTYAVEGKIFLNGALIDSGTLEGSSPERDHKHANLYWHSALRGSDETNTIFNGEMARLRTWNRELSQAEIQAAMAAEGLPDNIEGLAAFWRLDTGLKNEPPAFVGIETLPGNDDYSESLIGSQDVPEEPEQEPEHRVAGTVLIDGEPAERDVVVISNEGSERRVVGEGRSLGNGSFDIAYNYAGPVITLAVDDTGREWEAEAELEQGDIVHPSQPNGYVFVVTVGGTTGTQEPDWNIEGTTQSGEVTLDARPYYRPIASGPLNGEPTNPESGG